MRMGTITVSGLRYVIKPEPMKRLASGEEAFADLGREDFELVGMKQAGVDMKIGLDVASLAQAQIVDQIILIGDDSDFIPVIKVARKAGVDFIIDPMGQHLSKELWVNVDDVEDLSPDFRTRIGAEANPFSEGPEAH